MSSCSEWLESSVRASCWRWPPSCTSATRPRSSVHCSSELCGCLFLPHLRKREWAKVFTNAAIFALSSFAAAAVFLLIPATGHQPGSAGQLFAALPIGLTFSLVNFVLLVPVVAAVNKMSRTQRSERTLAWRSADLSLRASGCSARARCISVWDCGSYRCSSRRSSSLDRRSRATWSCGRRKTPRWQHSCGPLRRRIDTRQDTSSASRSSREYVGQELGFRPARLERLRYAALMHDIGKLIVPNQILNKPGKLTAAEYERMRHHESVSVELLRRIDFLAPVAPSIEADHGSTGSDDERFDGDADHCCRRRIRRDDLDACVPASAHSRSRVCRTS